MRQITYSGTEHACWCWCMYRSIDHGYRGTCWAIWTVSNFNANDNFMGIIEINFMSHNLAWRGNGRFNGKWSRWIIAVKGLEMCRAIARIILRSIFTPVIKIASYLPYLSSERISNFLSAITKVKITNFVKCHSILLALMCTCLIFLFSRRIIFF